VLKRLFNRVFRASKLAGLHPSNHKAASYFGYNLHGHEATAENAQNLSAVFNAVTMISQSVAKMPLLVYRRTRNGGKERASERVEYNLMHRRPNPHMTPIELKEMMLVHLLMRGDFFAYIENSTDSRPGLSLSPIHPDYVRDVTRNSRTGRLSYKVGIGAEEITTVSSNRMLHIKGLQSNGLRGQSVISFAADSLSAAMGSDKFSRMFFDNAAAPSGVLTHPGTIPDETFDEIKTQFKNRYQGSDNAWKPLILEGGLQWSPLSINPKDSQFLESRNFSIEEIARWFNIPPHKIKHLARSTFSNIEHQSLEYFADTIEPWAKRISDALNMFFFPDSDELFFEFLFDSLLTTDVKTRYEAHNLALTGGWKTRNEIRRVENLNPEVGLDEFLMPLNMGEVSEGPEENSRRSDAEVLREIREVYRELFSDKVEALLKADVHLASKSPNDYPERSSEKFKRFFSPAVFSYAERLGIPTADKLMSIEALSSNWRTLAETIGAEGIQKQSALTVANEIEQFLWSKRDGTTTA
jgi:HK97 family phage portal protein